MCDSEANLYSFISSYPSGVANVNGQNVEYVEELTRVQTPEQLAKEANEKANNNEYQDTSYETFSNCQARYNNNSIIMNIFLFLIIILIVYLIYINFNKNKK